MNVNEHTEFAQATSSTTLSLPVSPLDLLLDRLPRLLALSLTLSSRFEHDPSPQGVSEAFVRMESELVKEIGLWASEVGNLVAMGMGEVLENMSGAGRGRSRKSMSVDDRDDQEERLGFADILIMPIQRAARYKLLFRELMSNSTPVSSTRAVVGEALLSAERLATECDRRQVFDLHAIRRQVSVQGKKKKRPRSAIATGGSGSSRASEDI